MSRRLLTLAIAVLAIAPAAAHAAAPANDDRADAQSLDPLPATVKGTTIGATTEKRTEPFSECGDTGPSVWYSTTPGAAGRIVLTLQADGDLDAIVDVYRRVRSQLTAVRCDASGAKGQAGVTFRSGKATNYLIRVSQRSDSAASTFTLHVSAPIVPARPPGARLPAAGVTRTLDRVENTDDAWSFSLHAGVTYRMHLTGRNNRCFAHARLYRPHTRSFSAGSVRSMRCGGYLTFTPPPGKGGRYSILVESNGSVRGAQPYHFQVARADRDDTAPGIPIANHAHVRAALRGSRIDAVDLYRFDVTERSVTFVSLETSANFFVVLLDAHGHHLASGDTGVHRGLRPGIYYIAVRAQGTAGGTYTLVRDSRVITRTQATLEGSGRSLSIMSTTTPAVSGTLTFIVQRFDPLAGWLFARRIVTTASGGRASASYQAPGPGRYRVTAHYMGTADSAPSRSTYAYVEVGSPAG